MSNYVTKRVNIKLNGLTRMISGTNVVLKDCYAFEDEYYIFAEIIDDHTWKVLTMVRIN